MQTDRYSKYLNKIKNPQLEVNLGGSTRTYDESGYYSMLFHCNEELTSLEPVREEIYFAIRECGFSGGVYSLKIYDFKKLPDSKGYRVVFYAAGLDLQCPDSLDFENMKREKMEEDADKWRDFFSAEVPQPVS